RYERQLDVLHEPRLEDGVPVVAHPVAAEPVVVLDAAARLAELRDHGPGRGEDHRNSSGARSSLKAPSRAPFSPTTTTASAFAATIAETALRTVAVGGSSG